MLKVREQGLFHLGRRFALLRYRCYDFDNTLFGGCYGFVGKICPQFLHTFRVGFDS